MSKIVAGQLVDERKGWAQWNHLRMCIAASSILTLASYQQRIDAGEECTLDQGSIASLARGMAESAAMVAYLADPTLTSEQWELRKHVLWLHDATTRYKMFSKLENEVQATAFRADMQGLRTRIEAFPEFQALAPDRQGRVSAGSEIYLQGLRSAVRLAGWDVDNFDSMYGYLSSYTVFLRRGPPCEGVLLRGTLTLWTAIRSVPCPSASMSSNSAAAVVGRRTRSSAS